MAPWSVTAIADIPSRAASLKMVGAFGFERGASMRAAPSSREYSVCVWRWTNPGPGICAGCRLSWNVFHTVPGPMWTTYTAVIRRGPRLARPRTASRSLVETDPGKCPHEFIRQRVLQGDLLARDRVPEPERPGMEERPREPDPHRLVTAAPVGPITHDWVPDRLEVDPDLVRPAGLGHRLHQGRARHPLADLERRRGRSSVHPVHHDLRRPATERSLHCEASVLNPPSDQREVAPVDRVAPKQVAQPRVCPVGLGHDEQAAGSGIQPVDDPRSQLAARWSEPNPHPEQPVDERPGPTASGGMRDEPARFGHDDQVLVLEHHGDRGALGWERGLRCQIHGDTLTAVQPEGLGSRLPVHEDVPGRDRSLDVGPAGTGRRRDDRVEPPRVRDELLTRHRPAPPRSHRPPARPGTTPTPGPPPRARSRCRRR